MHHFGPIAGVAAHGGWIATAGYDNQLILWDAVTRRAVARANHDHLVNQCAFSPDGRWLVSASSDYSARLWSVPSLRLQAVFGGHGDDVDMAEFSPDGQRVATCALDRIVRIFALDGRCLHTLSGHTGNVLSVAWHGDGRQLVSSSVDGSLRTWDAHTGAALQVVDLGVRSDTVQIAPDGTVYAGDDQGRITVVDRRGVQSFDAHRAGIKKVTLDAGRGQLICLSYDRTMSVWAASPQAAPRELARTDLPELIWARSAAMTDDGKVAVATFGSTYALFDPDTLAWDLQGVAAGSAINAVLQVNERLFSVGDAGEVQVDGVTIARTGSLCNFLVAAGTRVLTGGQLGQLFDAHSGQPLHQHHSPLNCAVAFVRDGIDHVAIGSYTGEILVFALVAEGPPRLVMTRKAFENAVKGLSAGDGLLFSVCASTDIAWHRIDDWSLVRRQDRAHSRIANGCCAIGNGQFASVGRDRTLRLWGPEGAAHYDSPHPNSIKSVCVNEQRTALLTGSYGGTVALFDLQRHAWRDVERPTSAGISSITWDRRRSCFVAASYDGRLYPVAA